MRTLICTVGLLLFFSVYYCTAMPRAVDRVSPALCCFQFSKGTVRRNRIVSIAETHSGCRHKAFVVRTIKGREICVTHNVNWAQKLFQQPPATGGWSSSP
ncbi:C-C motif chemokine 4-like isoform 1-T2 [Spinachia spinachia]